MASGIIMLDAETPALKQISITSKINWNLCIFSQENRAGLQCPYAVKESVGNAWMQNAGRATKKLH